MQPTLAPAPHSMRASGSVRTANPRYESSNGTWADQYVRNQENAADQTLREHLLAQVHNTHPVPLKVEGLQPTSSVSPQDQNIDPAIAGAGIMGTSTAESGGDENGSDGKKSGKRALSTSKRAAQNRQAQRAFRQRKEGHIKLLEAQVKDYEKVNATLKATQDENYQLRDYIISLQSRLLESQGEFPQPPFNIEIHHHPRTGGGPPAPQQPAPTAQMAVPAAINQLQAAAAQAVAADLSGGKHPHDESFLTGSPDEKRARLSTSTDLRSIATQLGASNSDPLNNRPVVA